MPSSERAGLRVTALAGSAELGGIERVLLDLAARAFEWDVALRVLTPRGGPLIPILNELGVPAQVVEAARAPLGGWRRRLARHPFMRDAEVVYSVAFRTHAATAVERPTRADAQVSGGVGKPALVWHLHDFPPRRTGFLWKRLARWKPDALIASSHAVAAGWWGIEPRGRSTAQRLAVIPSGVDLDRFRPRARTCWIHDSLRIPHDDRLIGMPAVLARSKGQLEAIEAFGRVAGQFPEAHLVLVGGSLYRTAAEERYHRALEQAIAGRRAQGLDRVHLLPFQAKVELVYPELDAALHYSTRPEGFGRVVLEAMACGVPVLAAAEGGPRETLTEGGWLVPPRDPEKLAAAMVAALQLSAEARRQIGQQGRARAEDHYSARRFAREVAEVLLAASRGERGSGKREGPS